MEGDVRVCGGESGGGCEGVWREDVKGEDVGMCGGGCRGDLISGGTRCPVY